MRTYRSSASWMRRSSRARLAWQNKMASHCTRHWRSWPAMWQLNVTTSTVALDFRQERRHQMSWLLSPAAGCRPCLNVPSVFWMSVVREFDLDFKQLIGDTTDQKSGMMRRLTELIRTRQPQMDQRVIRKLASTRLHLKQRPDGPASLDKKM